MKWQQLRRPWQQPLWQLPLTPLNWPATAVLRVPMEETNERRHPQRRWPRSSLRNAVPFSFNNRWLNVKNAKVYVNRVWVFIVYTLTNCLFYNFLARSGDSKAYSQRREGKERGPEADVVQLQRRLEQLGEWGKQWQQLRWGDQWQCEWRRWWEQQVQWPQRRVLG